MSDKEETSLQLACGALGVMITITCTCGHVANVAMSRDEARTFARGLLGAADTSAALAGAPDAPQGHAGSA